MTDNPPGWHPDPLGRHEHRYWDGERWTEHVADQGNMSTDPLEAPPQAAAPIGPSMVNLPAISPDALQAHVSAPVQPEPEPEPQPAAAAAPAQPEPTAVQHEPEPAYTPAPAASAAPTAVLGEGDATPLGLIGSVAAPGSGHVLLGIRPQIGYGLLGAFAVAILVSWFVSFWVGLIIYLAAAGFALYDLRATVQPVMSQGLDGFAGLGPLAWRLVGAGGVALLISLVLPWYRVKATVDFRGIHQSISDSASGFGSLDLLDIYLLIIALAAIVLAAIHITQNTQARNALPPVTALALAGLAAIGWILIIFRLLKVPGVGGIPDTQGVDINFYRGLGIWLAFTSALTIAGGALGAARSRQP